MKRIILIALCFLTLTGCPNSNRTTEPEVKELATSYHNVITSSKNMTDGEFQSYLDGIGNLRWSGKIVSTNRDDRTIQFQINGTILTLKIIDRNDPIITEAEGKVGETVTIRIKVTGFDSNGILTGNLIHIFI